MSHTFDCMAGEHRIAEIGPASLKEGAGDDVIAGRSLQVDEKGLVRLLQRHFLQRDEVGVELG